MRAHTYTRFMMRRARAYVKPIDHPHALSRICGILVRRAMVVIDIFGDGLMIIAALRTISRWSWKRDCCLMPWSTNGRANAKQAMPDFFVKHNTLLRKKAYAMGRKCSINHIKKTYTKPNVKNQRRSPNILINKKCARIQQYARDAHP